MGINDKCKDMMLVDFGFFEGDSLLHRGQMLIAEDESVECYGSHEHFEMEVEGNKHRVVMFKGLVIRHSFEEPACPLTIEYFEVLPTNDHSAPFKQSKLFSSALRMGVHDSDDWESIAMGEKHNMAFRCKAISIKDKKAT